MSTTLRNDCSASSKDRSHDFNQESLSAQEKFYPFPTLDKLDQKIYQLPLFQKIEEAFQKKKDCKKNINGKRYPDFSSHTHVLEDIYTFVFSGDQRVALLKNFKKNFSFNQDQAIYDLYRELKNIPDPKIQGWIRQELARGNFLESLPNHSIHLFSKLLFHYLTNIELELTTLDHFLVFQAFLFVNLYDQEQTSTSTPLYYLREGDQIFLCYNIHNQNFSISISNQFESTIIFFRDFFKREASFIKKYLHSFSELFLLIHNQQQVHLNPNPLEKLETIEKYKNLFLTFGLVDVKTERVLERLPLHFHTDKEILFFKYLCFSFLDLIQMNYQSDYFENIYQKIYSHDPQKTNIVGKIQNLKIFLKQFQFPSQSPYHQLHHQYHKIERAIKNSQCQFSKRKSELIEKFNQHYIKFDAILEFWKDVIHFEELKIIQETSLEFIGLAEPMNLFLILENINSCFNSNPENYYWISPLYNSIIRLYETSLESQRNVVRKELGLFLENLPRQIQNLKDPLSESELKNLFNFLNWYLNLLLKHEGLEETKKNLVTILQSAKFIGKENFIINYLKNNEVNISHSDSISWLQSCLPLTLCQNSLNQNSIDFFKGLIIQFAKNPYQSSLSCFEYLLSILMHYDQPNDFWELVQTTQYNLLTKKVDDFDFRFYQLLFANKRHAFNPIQIIKLKNLVIQNLYFEHPHECLALIKEIFYSELNFNKDLAKEYRAILINLVDFLLNRNALTTVEELLQSQWFLKQFKMGSEELYRLYSKFIKSKISVFEDLTEIPFWSAIFENAFSSSYQNCHEKCKDWLKITPLLITNAFLYNQVLDLLKNKILKDLHRMNLNEKKIELILFLSHHSKNNHLNLESQIWTETLQSFIPHIASLKIASIKELKKFIKLLLKQENDFVNNFPFKEFREMILKLNNKASFSLQVFLIKLLIDRGIEEIPLKKSNFLGLLEYLSKEKNIPDLENFLTYFKNFKNLKECWRFWNKIEMHYFENNRQEWLTFFLKQAPLFKTLISQRKSAVVDLMIKQALNIEDFLKAKYLFQIQDQKIDQEIGRTILKKELFSNWELFKSTHHWQEIFKSCCETDPSLIPSLLNLLDQDPGQDFILFVNDPIFLQKMAHFCVLKAENEERLDQLCVKGYLKLNSKGKEELAIARVILIHQFPEHFTHSKSALDYKLLQDSSDPISLLTLLKSSLLRSNFLDISLWQKEIREGLRKLIHYSNFGDHKKKSPSPLLKELDELYTLLLKKDNFFKGTFLFLESLLALFSQGQDCISLFLKHFKEYTQLLLEHYSDEYLVSYFEKNPFKVVFTFPWQKDTDFKNIFSLFPHKFWNLISLSSPETVIFFQRYTESLLREKKNTRLNLLENDALTRDFYLISYFASYPHLDLNDYHFYLDKICLYLNLFLIKNELDSRFKESDKDSNSEEVFRQLINANVQLFLKVMIKVLSEDDLPNFMIRLFSLISVNFDSERMFDNYINLKEGILQFLYEIYPNRAIAEKIIYNDLLYSKADHEQRGKEIYQRKISFLKEFFQKNAESLSIDFALFGSIFLNAKMENLPTDGSRLEYLYFFLGEFHKSACPFILKGIKKWEKNVLKIFKDDLEKTNLFMLMEDNLEAKKIDLLALSTHYVALLPKEDLEKYFLKCVLATTHVLEKFYQFSDMDFSKIIPIFTGLHKILKRMEDLCRLDGALKKLKKAYYEGLKKEDQIKLNNFFSALFTVKKLKVRLFPK